MINISFWLFAAGFFTCTWDRFATIEAGGTTLKLYQLCFLLCAGSLFYVKRKEGLTNYLRPIALPFATLMLVLAGYYLGLAPWSAFPRKSFLYSCWLIFDVLAVWLSVQHLARYFPRPRFTWVVWATLLFNSAIILIDHVAYQYGYTAGLIGRNQDAILKWGLSRPHAFSSEPSFIAAFLSLGLLTLSTLIPTMKRKWPMALGLVIVLFATVVPSSRTGWFNLFFGACLLWVIPMLAGRRIKRRFLMYSAGTLAALIALFFVVTPAKQIEVLNRFLISGLVVGEDGSGNARLRAHKLAYDIAKETHWIGTGFAASYRYYIDKGNEDQSEYLFDKLQFNDRHFGNELVMSTWGQLLAEGGIIAVLLFALAGFFHVRTLYRQWKAETGYALLGPVVAAVIFFAFTAFWLGNVNRGDIWVWYALWSALAQKST